MQPFRQENRPQDSWQRRDSKTFIESWLAINGDWPIQDTFPQGPARSRARGPATARRSRPWASAGTDGASGAPLAGLPPAGCARCEGSHAAVYYDKIISLITSSTDIGILRIGTSHSYRFCRRWLSIVMYLFVECRISPSMA